MNARLSFVVGLSLALIALAGCVPVPAAVAPDAPPAAAIATTSEPTATPIPTEAPPTADFYATRAEGYFDEGRYAEAIADYDQAIALQPEDPELYKLRGNVYLAQEDTERARADYNRAIELDPEYADAYFNRALTFYREENLDDALADISRGIELEPDDVQALALRGQIYLDMDDLEKARADFDRAIELDPEYAEAYYGRALTFYFEGEFNLTLADLEQVIALSDDPDMREAAQEFSAVIEGMAALSSSSETAPSIAHPGRIAYSGPLTAALDIYMVAPSGGQTIELTNNAQYDYLPRWSPDGRWIAFIKEAANSEDTDLWVIEPRAGAEARQITTDGMWESEDYSWAPDSSAIAYWGPGASGADTDVYRLDLDTGEVTNLTDDSPMWDAHPAWSPDGEWIAFVSDRAEGGKALDDICIMRPDGSEFRKLTDNGQDWEDQHPAWSPDGKQIAFIRFNIATSTVDLEELPEGGPGGLWVMDADGANPRLVTTLAGVFFMTDAPVWSPDGKQIAFLMRGGEENGVDVWVVPAAGGDERNVTQLPGDEMLISWSPDSQALTFTRRSVGPAYAQWVVEADGTGLRALLPPGQGALGQWSPPAFEE